MSPLPSATEASFIVDAGASGALTVLERGDEHRPARFIMKIPPGYAPPVDQVHPDASEHIRVLSGRLQEIIDGVVHDLGPGDEVFIPRGAWHRSRNVSAEPAEKLVVMSPGMHAEDMLARMFTAKKNTRGLQQKLAMINVLVEYPAAVRFRRPALALFKVIARLGRALGLLAREHALDAAPLPAAITAEREQPALAPADPIPPPGSPRWSHS